MKNLRDFTYEELAEEVSVLGEKPYRASQIYKWVYARRADSFDSMTDISKAFRETLKERYCLDSPKVVDVQASVDGTKKFLSECADGARIESVIISEPRRLTLCVSTQAGCALGCRFCMTGLSGFIRNLTLAELTGQVIRACDYVEEGRELTNVVLMGMGEPLLNYDNVVRFLSVLTDGAGFGFSHNKVTLSTSGVVPAIKRLAADSNVNLAVSLNATTDAVRDRLMPINRKYPLSELMAVLRTYPLKGKKHITFEYVLLKDVNDTPEDAARLVRLLGRIKSKVNLIPFNEFPGSEFKSPEDRRVRAFHKTLMDAGFNVVVRSSKGEDIQAACGQLRGRYATGETLL